LADNVLQKPFKGRVYGPASGYLSAVIAKTRGTSGYFMQGCCILLNFILDDDLRVTALFCMGNLASSITNALLMKEDTVLLETTLEMLVQCNVNVDDHNMPSETAVGAAYFLGNLSYAAPSSVGVWLSESERFKVTIAVFCKSFIAHKNLFGSFWCVWSCMHVYNCRDIILDVDYYAVMLDISDKFAAAFPYTESVPCMWSTLAGLFSLLRSKLSPCKRFGYWALVNMAYSTKHQSKLLKAHHFASLVDCLVMLVLCVCFVSLFS
jgi:hypothetical protein